jgi:hypothetical protein
MGPGERARWLRLQAAELSLITLSGKTVGLRPLELIVHTASAVAEPDKLGLRERRRVLNVHHNLDGTPADQLPNICRRCSHGPRDCGRGLARMGSAGMTGRMGWLGGVGSLVAGPGSDLSEEPASAGSLRRPPGLPRGGKLRTRPRRRPGHPARRHSRHGGPALPVLPRSMGRTDTDGISCSSCPTTARSLAICAAIPTRVTLWPGAAGSDQGAPAASSGLIVPAPACSRRAE